MQVGVQALPTLQDWTKEACEANGEKDLIPLMACLETAIAEISSKVARASIEGLLGLDEAAQGAAKGSGDEQKKLDVVAVSDAGVMGGCSGVWNRY